MKLFDGWRFSLVSGAGTARGDAECLLVVGWLGRYPRAMLFANRTQWTGRK